MRRTVRGGETRGAGTSEDKINAFCRKLSPLMGRALAEIAIERRAREAAARAGGGSIHSRHLICRDRMPMEDRALPGPPN